MQSTGRKGDQIMKYTDHSIKISVQNLNFVYGQFQALKNISMEINANEVRHSSGHPDAENPHF